MYRVELIDMEKLRDSRDEWNALVAAMKTPSIFCSWEWIDTWWKHFGDGYEPFMLFVYDGGKLKGILPLASIKKSAWGRALSGRQLLYCGSAELYPDHIDIICAQDEAGFCLSSVFEFLTSEYNDWDILGLSMLTEGGDLLEFIKAEGFPLKLQLMQRTVAPFLDLSCGFESYMRSFDSKKRNQMRQREKKLYDDGFSYHACGPSERPEALKALFRLHELRAIKKEIVSTFNSEKLFKFHSELVTRLDNEDTIWLRMIKRDDEIISTLYAFGLGDHLFYYQIGIDPEWESFSPGTLLMQETIKEAFSKDYLEFDFLRGGEMYKSRWTKTERVLYSVNVYNNTLRGNLLKTASYSKGLVKTDLKKFISGVTSSHGVQDITAD